MWYSLDDNGIGDDGASVIGQALQSNSALTWLRYGLDLSTERFGH